MSHDTCHPFAEPEPDIMGEIPEGTDLDALAEVGRACWEAGITPEAFREAFG